VVFQQNEGLLFEGLHGDAPFLRGATYAEMVCVMTKRPANSGAVRDELPIGSEVGDLDHHLF
jgi:hypothetical protein